MSTFPARIMTSEPGSFAQRTVLHRMPRIIDRVLATNAYPQDITTRLARLREEIAEGHARPPALAGSLNECWRKAWAPWQGCSWRQLPWLLAEALFYQRLLEAVRFFDAGPWKRPDPFAADKASALERGLAAMETDPPPSNELPLRVRHLLLASLWGNRVDLSNLAAEESSLEPRLENDRLLIDHTGMVVAALMDPSTRVLQVVCDNAGPELLADLLLVHRLLADAFIDKVCLHLKPQPLFVSDATLADLRQTIAAMRGSACPSLAQAGDELAAWHDAGRIVLRAHPFWVGPLGLVHLPHDLLSELARADLVLFKGDANYRRLLDDRHWAPTASLEEIARYLPFSFACLRTIKAELIVGLPPGMASRMAELDPEWQTTGRWGLVHFVPYDKASSGSLSSRREV